MYLKNKLVKLIVHIIEARVQDKRLLMDEVIDLKKTIAKNECEISYKDSQLMDARNELEKSATALKNAETKIISLKSQVRHYFEIASYH
jgi:hypothetical protein